MLQFLNPPPVLPLANMIFAFKTSSFFSGKLIVFILFVASIFAWTIMVTKFLELRKAEAESKKFTAGYRREKHPLALFLKRQKYAESPLFKVYEGACAALGVELEGRGSEAAELFVRDPEAISARLNMMQVNAVRNAAERTVADQGLLLERNMGYLATAVNASPLMGLLGTVWGVLDAFVEMALIGMVNLASVAPGIAAALLTTVVGLLVAIPSAIGYNILTSRIRGICVQMENFTDELMADMQRTFVQD